MEVVILGSGTGEPSTKRGSPGILVKAGEERFLFDLGAGTLRKMLEAGYTYLDIDRIFLTHFHVDHVSDLAPLFFVSKNPRAPRARDLPLIGPKGLKDFYALLLNLYGDQIYSDTYTVPLMEMEEGVLVGNGWEIMVRPLAHFEESIGYRIENNEGKVIAYSGDTDFCENLLILAQNADLLVLECSFPNAMKVEGHLTPSLCGMVAQRAKAKRLLLTHFYPICDQVNILEECGRLYSGEILIAQDLMWIKV